MAPRDSAPDDSTTLLPDPQTEASSAVAKEQRPQRKDAQRNREQLLAAASLQFTERGVDVPLEDIASSAHVGIGTLYRHFPTRGALIEAVFHQEVGQLCESVEELSRTLSAVDALAQWMQNFVAYVAAKRGLSGALKELMNDNPDYFAETRTRIRVAANSVLSAAVDSGAIRPDVDADDLIRAMGGICMATDDLNFPERLVGLLMDGLRFKAPSYVATKS